MDKKEKAHSNKDNIIFASLELFSKNGFENTSMQDIINKVGIAKGTLYYYFKSKEEILDNVIEKITLDMLNNVQKIANDKSIPPIERLIKAIVSMNVQDEMGKNIMDNLHKSENALIHQKFQNIFLTKAPKLLSIIIQDAIDDKLLYTPYPIETLEMILSYGDMINDYGSRLSGEERFIKLKSFAYNIIRLLNMEEGSLEKFILNMMMGDVYE